MDVAILVLGMFIGGDPPTAKDAHAVWQSQLNEASSFLAGREYLKAEAAYGGALKTASELEPSELYRGITLNDLGILFQDLGRYIDAEKLFLQSLSVLERRYSTSDRVVVRAGANLVSLYLETQQITKAESILLPLIPSQESVPAGPGWPGAAGGGGIAVPASHRCARQNTAGGIPRGIGNRDDRSLGSLQEGPPVSRGARVGCQGRANHGNGRQSFSKSGDQDPQQSRGDFR